MGCRGCGEGSVESESSEGGCSLSFGMGRTFSMFRETEIERQTERERWKDRGREKERETARPGEPGKVWTMTQGHGGGMERLLIAACGSSGRHGGAAVTPAPAPSHPTPAVTRSGSGRKRSEMLGGGGSGRSGPARCRWNEIQHQSASERLWWVFLGFFC